MSKWISVEDRMPKERGRYLVALDDVDGVGWTDAEPWIAFYNPPGSVCAYWDCCDAIEDGLVVTHWMELPRVPELLGSQ